MQTRPAGAVLADGSAMSGVADVLRLRAAASPAAVAIEEAGVAVTYGDLDRRASQLASGLRALGAGPGDRVAFVGPNSAALLEVFHGAPRIGAVAVPVNHRLAAPELRDLLADAEPRLVIVDTDTAAALGSPADWLPPGCPLLTTGEAGSYQAWRDAAAAVDPGVVPHTDATQLMLYSSGTTGRPKGIELTGANLAYALGGLQETAAIDTDSVVLCPIPFFHIAGLGMALASAIDGGRLLLGDAGGPGGLLDLLVARRVSHAVAVPTVLQQVLALPGTAGADWSALRFLVYGAAPMPAPLLARVIEVFDCDCLQGYGLTESTGGACRLTPEDHRLALAGRPELLRSVGRVLPGTGLRIVDPKSGEDVSVGQRGEIWLAGPSVMRGYWRRPELTAEAVTPDGWLRTGDGGSLDDDGYVTLHDRLKDMIVSGGENVYPAEVESVLTAHPAVLEVAVVGVPDDRWGEVPFAWIVTRPDQRDIDAADILAWARDRLAHYKVPAAARFVDALPRNASGKLLKSVLRAMGPVSGPRTT
jgi:acyl-CoA synthetase (AMP-forming)/AMP-acid ligase II